MKRDEYIEMLRVYQDAHQAQLQLIQLLESRRQWSIDPLALTALAITLSEAAVFAMSGYGVAVTLVGSVAIGAVSYAGGWLSEWLASDEPTVIYDAPNLERLSDILIFDDDPEPEPPTIHYPEITGQVPQTVTLLGIDNINAETVRRAMTYHKYSGRDVYVNYAGVRTDRVSSDDADRWGISNEAGSRLSRLLLENQMVDVSGQLRVLNDAGYAEFAHAINGNSPHSHPLREASGRPPHSGEG